MIIRYVKHDLNALNKFTNSEYSEEQIREKTKIPKYAENIYPNNDKVSYFIRFEVGGYGMGSGGCYTGFYYSEKDKQHDYNFGDGTYKFRIINSNKFVMESKNPSYDDNHLYLDKIKPHWYYYEECF
jgi:hypothetical protein